MPSNEQRRAAAKRKLERQMATREQKAKQRRMIAIGTTVVVVVAVVVGFVYFSSTSGNEPAASPQQPANCAFPPSQGEPAAKPVEAPEGGAPNREGTVDVTMKTSQGELGLTLDRAKAPCTVKSFEHLTQAKYFDDTDCHRLTTGEGLKVLQCGDPTGSGSGGPGYSFADELPTDLEPAPEPYGAKGSKIYPRGTLAMANSGPNTNGSQFFMVYEDSFLPPNYTVFGTIDEAGLKVLDKVAKAGVDPTNGEGDGKPKLPMHIDKATVGA